MSSSVCSAAMVRDERALGMRIVLLGASIGSIITPILVEYVLVELGFPRAVRIMAFVYLFFCVGVTALR